MLVLGYRWTPRGEVLDWSLFIRKFLWKESQQNNGCFRRINTLAVLKKKSLKRLIQTRKVFPKTWAQNCLRGPWSLWLKKKKSSGEGIFVFWNSWPHSSPNLIPGFQTYDRNVDNKLCTDLESAHFFVIIPETWVWRKLKNHLFWRYPSPLHPSVSRQNKGFPTFKVVAFREERK